jgi:hypothetical protein
MCLESIDLEAAGQRSYQEETLVHFRAPFKCWQYMYATHFNCPVLPPFPPAHLRLDGGGIIPCNLTVPHTTRPGPRVLLLNEQADGLRACTTLVSVAARSQQGMPGADIHAVECVNVRFEHDCQSILCSLSEWLAPVA